MSSWNQTATSNLWYDIAISSSGQYLSATVFFGNIYISKDFGSSKYHLTI